MKTKFARILMVVGVLCFAVAGYFFAEMREPWANLDIGWWTRSSNQNGWSMEKNPHPEKGNFLPQGPILVVPLGSYAESRLIAEGVARRLRNEPGSGWRVEVSGEPGPDGKPMPWPRPDGVAPAITIYVRYDKSLQSISTTPPITTTVSGRAYFEMMTGEMTPGHYVAREMGNEPACQWLFGYAGTTYSSLSQMGIVGARAVQRNETEQHAREISLCVKNELRKRDAAADAAMQPALRKLIPDYKPPVDLDVLKEYRPVQISAGATVLSPHLSRWCISSDKKAEPTLKAISDDLKARGWVINMGFDSRLSASDSGGNRIEAVRSPYALSISAVRDPAPPQSAMEPGNTHFDVVYRQFTPVQEAAPRIHALGAEAPEFLLLNYGLMFKPEDVTELKSKCSPLVVELMLSTIPLMQSGKVDDARKAHKEAYALAEKENQGKGRLPAFLVGYPFASVPEE